jgi:predicted metalloendopeptidase
VVYKVGHPEFWLDYSKLEIVRGDALGNVSARRISISFDLAKIGKPTDRSEWSTGASTNNAYYDEQMVDITIPAAALQPPNFAVTADDAVNYGNLGALIGHELTHGLMTKAAATTRGNLSDWWTAQERRRSRRARPDWCASIMRSSLSKTNPIRPRMCGWMAS